MSRQTEQITSWLAKPISCEVDTKARLWNVTRSKAGAMLIERGLASDFFAGYEKTIADVIRHTLAAERRQEQNRMMTLLFRIYARVCQIMYLLINVLSRVGTGRPITPSQLDKVVEWSRNQAREDVVKRNKATEALGQAVADYLEAERLQGREEGQALG